MQLWTVCEPHFERVGGREGDMDSIQCWFLLAGSGGFAGYKGRDNTSASLTCLSHRKCLLNQILCKLYKPPTVYCGEGTHALKYIKIIVFVSLFLCEATKKRKKQCET